MPVPISQGGTSQTTAPGARKALGLEIGVSVQPYDPGLDSLSNLASNGFVVRTANDTFTSRTLVPPAAGFTITNPAGTAGDPTFVLSNDLAGLEGISTTGLAVRTAANTWTTRTLTGPAAGIQVQFGDGVSGNPTLALIDDLQGLEGLATVGISVRSGPSTWVTRTITGTSNEISLSNGDGASGNPVISLPSSLTFTGKTITGGTFSGPTISGSPNASSATWTNLGSVTTVDINGGTVDGVVLATSKIRSDTEITDTSDTSKEIQFVLSGITTATTRTVTMPNRNIIVQKHTRQVFTSGTSWTKPTGCTYIQVEAVGGGGGGGGVDGQGAGTFAGGSGGGSGAYGITELIDVRSISSCTIAIGAAGSAGASGNNAGGNGGNTTFNDGTTTYTWGGGVGGGGMTASATNTTIIGGAGGQGTNVVAYGNMGIGGARTSLGTSGPGGSSGWGRGGPGQNVNASAVTGNAATGFGAGGAGGAVGGVTTDAAGGAGTAGRMVVWEYYT